jgi:hypothetical protein
LTRAAALSQVRTAEREVVHPAGHNTNPNPLVTGPTTRLMARNAKVRRDGYRKKQAI